MKLTMLVVLQIVGNLIYYRYMNPAIVAPDGFDVLEISAGSTLLPEQRRVLGSIARMLQHAAANKHFQGDSPHIQNLNEYISHTHGRVHTDGHHLQPLEESPNGVPLGDRGRSRASHSGAG